MNTVVVAVDPGKARTRVWLSTNADGLLVDPLGWACDPAADVQTRLLRGPLGQQRLEARRARRIELGQGLPQPAAPVTTIRPRPRQLVSAALTELEVLGVIDGLGQAQPQHLPEDFRDRVLVSAKRGDADRKFSARARDRSTRSRNLGSLRHGASTPHCCERG